MKKKNENKGFTLVELIVVLVILAILAAILVPALLGYIDRARNQQAVLNAKSAMTAAQAELSSIYGKSEMKVTKDNKARILTTADVTCDSLKIYVDKWNGDTAISNNHGAYTVKRVDYVDKTNGDHLYFSGSEWVETAPSDLNTFTEIVIVTGGSADTSDTNLK